MASTTPGADVIFVDLPGLWGAGAPTTSTVPSPGASSTGPAFYPIVRGLVMLSRDTTQAPGPSYMETYFTTAGSRVFNVSINGTQVLANFDIVKASGGGNIANIQQFSTTANASGQIVITFTSLTNNALISGIEID